MTDKDYEPSSGTTSLLGYLYQRDVSVWAALVLMLDRNATACLEIEPVSEEDLESDIEGDAPTVTEVADVASYRLVIQCKTRSTGPWKLTDISNLVDAGVRREKVKDRLSDANIRYVMVTNAAIEGRLIRIGSDSLLQWPAAGQLPPTLVNVLSADADGRFSILHSLDTERLRFRTEALLRGVCHIPSGLIHDCREEFRRTVLGRMRGEAGGVFSREDAIRIVIKYKGYVGRSPDLEDFVQPSNWADLKNALAERHAVIIAGPSGSGKTSAGKALVADLRDQLPGLNVEYVDGGPEKVTGYQGALPVVFEVEDPWGRFEPEPKAKAWRHGIIEVLRSASVDRKIVITTRADMMVESKAQPQKKWFITLDEASYSPAKRIELFERFANKLPRHIQERILPYRKEAVDELTTPLFMQLYFDAVAEGPAAKESDRSFVSRCLKQAEEESIEVSLGRKIDDSESHRWAIVLWAAFKFKAHQSRKQLRDLEDALFERDDSLEDGLFKLIELLVAGHYLRERNDVFALRHPRVDLGLRNVVLGQKRLAAKTLRLVVQALTPYDAEGAANVLRAARQLDDFRLEIDPDSQSAIDVWLRDRLTAVGLDFDDDLDLAAVTGSPQSPVTLLANWLNDKSDARRYFMDDWIPRALDESEFALLVADPATRPICMGFVRRKLPRVNGFYSEGFADNLLRLADGLNEAFIDAAMDIVQDGFNSNANVIVAGAITNLEAFEQVVDASVNYDAKISQRNEDDFYLRKLNGEFGEEEAEHYLDDRSEDAHTARSFLETYAERVRSVKGWQALAQHRYAEHLHFFWARAIRLAAGALPTDDEWLALASRLFDTDEEDDLWNAIGDYLPACLLPFLEKRIEQGAGKPSIRQEAGLVLTRLTPQRISGLSESLERTKNYSRICELALDIRNATTHAWMDEGAAAVAQICEAASTKTETVVRAILDPTSAAALDGEARAMLEGIDAGPNNVLRVAQAEVLAKNDGANVTALLKTALCVGKENTDDEVKAITKAIQLAGRLDIDSLVEYALKHRFADVRQIALELAARHYPDELPDELLAFAGDPGNRVRKQLLKLLAVRKSRRHEEALVKLAADNWSTHYDRYGEDSSYPIAVEAARALGTYPRLQINIAEKLLEIAKTTSDSDVQRGLLNSLLTNGTHDVRHEVKRLALDLTNQGMALAVCNALVSLISVGDFNLELPITARMIAEAPPSIAARLSLLAGIASPDHDLISLGRGIAANIQKRALLVPAWIGASTKGREIASSLERLIPASVVGALSKAPSPDALAPRELLDDMGDVRTVRAVRKFLGRFFVE
ncbi:hypothetical protein EVC45_37610 [Paraburkholderia sp. UYCP14C]|uniref:HEAT repeat domain-containing protein n=1 Tax=Paraburkholderia sp. UYCP14C TaxID=2511130 RepID=UPI00101FFB00|nr:HEAT repeat domain-containing protein [Paraburkholderia sp. UYCP14C]RZF24682.1 hypothetical protein EVC45_37610 [Paraburkholderia sp. UYCP14C]